MADDSNNNQVCENTWVGYLSRYLALPLSTCVSLPPIPWHLDPQKSPTLRLLSTTTSTSQTLDVRYNSNGQMTDVAGRDMAVADEEEAPSVQAIQATPLLTEELLQSARQQLANSRNQPEAAAPDVDGSPPAPAHVVHFDVDLSNRGISELPEELIDVIKDEVNRLALRRNHLTGLSGLSPRISECTNLKYLVLKRNKIREFPPAVGHCDGRTGTCRD